MALFNKKSAAPQQKSADFALLPNHVGIIMDGNGRWAKKRGLPRSAGHKAGAEVFRTISKACGRIGIPYVTFYAFSTENWKRTKEEVGALMILLQKYLEEFLSSNDFDNIKINVLGDTSKLGEGLQKSITKILHETENNTGLVLNIAFNYGGRDEIVKAVKRISTEVKENKLDIDDINEETFSKFLYTAGQPDPDLLIRTSGEQRLSNYLLWQLAYTEFYFIKKYWPDFSEQDLDEAISKFEARNRNFGGK